MLAHYTQENQEPVQNKDGSGEIGLSVSTLHWRCRHASLSWLWKLDQRFCISKVKEKDFLSCVYCIAIANVCNRDVNETLWISKQYRHPAFKTMHVQFCNDAKSCAYWLVNETLWYETETRSRHLIFSPRRDPHRDLPTFPQDRDETETPYSIDKYHK